MATINKFDQATIKAAYISSELTDQFMLERNRATSFLLDASADSTEDHRSTDFKKYHRAIDYFQHDTVAFIIR